MVHSSRRKNFSFILALVAVGLLLAIALPSATLADNHDGGPPPTPGSGGPPPPPVPTSNTGNGGPPPPPTQVPTQVPTQAPTPVPTQDMENGMTTPQATPTPGTGNGGTTPTPTPGMDGGMADRDPSSSPNSIVAHAATPAQLVKSGGGLQYYYIGADGSSVTGPTLPSFSDLAEMYPSGDWVPLLDAPNPLTGKHVNVDYIPNEQKIRVSTHYPDNEYDTNKPYIFTVDADYSVSHQAW